MDEVHRTIKQGFQVDGLSIKGFVNSSLSAFPENPKQSYKVEFRDGAVQNFDVVEDVLSLPNVGKREINSLNIELCCGDDLKRFFISVKISNGEDKIVYDVSSPDQNWNRSAQSECEEFIFSIKRILWSDLAEKSSWAFLVAPFILMMFAMGSIYSQDDSATRLHLLKQALNNNSLSTSEAIYKYAEWQSQSPHLKPPLYLIAGMTIPLISIFLMRSSVIDFIFKSKIFYIGGMVNIINQRRAMHALIWVSVVLSVVIGLGVNWLSARFFSG